jgi:hypothetical protein
MFVCLSACLVMSRSQRVTAGKSPDRLSLAGLGKGGRAIVLSEGDADNLTKQARSLERRVGFLEGRVVALENRVKELEGEARRRGKVEDEQQVKVVGLR